MLVIPRGICEGPIRDCQGIDKGSMRVFNESGLGVVAGRGVWNLAFLNVH